MALAEEPSRVWEARCCMRRMTEGCRPRETDETRSCDLNCFEDGGGWTVLMRSAAVEGEA